METKPGYLTTEFWTMVFAQVFPFLNLIGAWNWASNWHAGILTTVLAGAYAAARGLAKQGVAYTPPPANRR